MDEENKFYVPNITEFHVEFEYEFKDWFTTKGTDAVTGESDYSGWQKGIVTEDFYYSTEAIEKINNGKFGCDYQHPFDRIRYYIETKQIRVRYLDKEDIESLGFKHIGGKMLKDVGQEYKWNNGRYWVHLNYTKLSDHCVLKIETSVEHYSVKTLVVHSIGIKNKSELIILMKQLNIN